MHGHQLEKSQVALKQSVKSSGYLGPYESLLMTHVVPISCMATYLYKTVINRLCSQIRLFLIFKKCSSVVIFSLSLPLIFFLFYFLYLAPQSSFLHVVYKHQNLCINKIVRKTQAYYYEAQLPRIRSNSPEQWVVFTEFKKNVVGMGFCVWHTLAVRQLSPFKKQELF